MIRQPGHVVPGITGIYYHRDRRRVLELSKAQERVEETGKAQKQSQYDIKRTLKILV